MKKSLFTKLSLPVFLAFTLLLNACGTEGYQPEENNGNEGTNPPEEQLPTNEAVPADATLEAVTWNLEWYGNNGQGPTDETLQTKNVLRVVDSLKADLYAFQEIAGQQELNELAEHMTGYRGFVADYVQYNQKMAFVYNTNTIDSLRAGPVSNVRDAYSEDWDHYWASGRLPLYFQFTYTPKGGQSTDVYAVVIHAKANTGGSSAEYAEAYQRRQQAAEGLYYYLQDQKPGANIILLGDYNDDVDQSIYYEQQDGEKVYPETPYDEFVEDSQHFEVVTHILSKNKESSYLGEEGGEDLIDHITMSNELFDEYIDGSVGVYQKAQTFIPNYGETTSDHLPVWVKFDMVP